jgi:hypothetical protein
MKRIAAVFAASAVVLIAIPFISTAQAQRVPSRWHYAYVAFAPWQGAAEIVYVETDGCRRQVVAVDPVMSETDRTVIDVNVTQGRAAAQAVLILGNNGWEMIGEGSSYCRGANEKAILFKRAGR